MLELSQNSALSWPLVRNNYTVLLPGGFNFKFKTNSFGKQLNLIFCISAPPEGLADRCGPLYQLSHIHSPKVV